MIKTRRCAIDEMEFSAGIEENYLLLIAAVYQLAINEAKSGHRGARLFLADTAPDIAEMIKSNEVRKRRILA